MLVDDGADDARSVVGDLEERKAVGEERIVIRYENKFSPGMG